MPQHAPHCSSQSCLAYQRRLHQYHHLLQHANAMHDHHHAQPATRLHSEHALSLPYTDWLTLKAHHHHLAATHRRQHTLRNTVLTLFRRYQADAAYVLWTDAKRQQGCWLSEAPEVGGEGPDVDGYHCGVRSERFRAGSSEQYLEWMDAKQATEREVGRLERRQQAEQKRRENEEAKEQHERAQAEYSKWHTQKAQQLSTRRTQRQSQQATQRAAQQQTRAEQRVKADALYQQWTADKHSQQLRHDQRQQRRQHAEQARRQDRHRQFEALYPLAIKQYVATIDRWRSEEQTARQRQADRERAKAGRGGAQHLTRKEEGSAGLAGTAFVGPSTHREAQQATSARLAAGKRVEGIKLPFGASTASTAAMSASSLFASFSSSSSSSLAGPLGQSSTAPATARSTASVPGSRRGQSSKRKQPVARPPWNDDSTVSYT